MSRLQRLALPKLTKYLTHSLLHSIVLLLAEVSMTFPAELVDTIVDKLQDDKSALATCSLLSRIWVPRSRYHLFHSITVTVESDGSGFKPFLDFLRSSPNTIDHIQELTLDGSVDVDWEIYYLSTITQNTSHPLLFQILDYLPALTSLELRCMWFTLPHRWTEEERRIALRGPKRPLALRRLTLCLIGYIGFSAIINTNVFELRGILAAFSSIKELHTSGLMMHPNGIEWPQDNRNKFLGDQREPLSLVIRRCNTLTHIFQSICHIPVESLCVETGEEAVTGNYIKNLGTALKHLDLDFTEALKFFRELLVTRISTCI